MRKGRRVKKIGLSDLQAANGGLVLTNARLASFNKSYDPSAPPSAPPSSVSFAPTPVVTPVAAPVIALPQINPLLTTADPSILPLSTSDLYPTAAFDPTLSALSPLPSLYGPSYSDSTYSMLAMVLPQILNSTMSFGGGLPFGGGAYAAPAAARYARDYGDDDVTDFVDDDDEDG
jgi:hypothetical protein